MSISIDDFRHMIFDLNPQTLSEICEKFLYNHEEAVSCLISCSAKKGVYIDNDDVKRCMMTMQRDGEFDDIECFGIELGSNMLYKKFHPSDN